MAMSGFIVKICPSDSPQEEKERRLQDVLEFLLYSVKDEKGQREEKDETNKKS